MSTHKHFDLICVAVIILSLIITVLFMNGEALGITVVPDQDRESYNGSEYFTENDLDAEWDDTDATVITLDGDSASVKGTGAYANAGSVTIVQSGYYVVSGTLTNGSLIVDAKNYSKVWIRLKGVEITCTDSACIDIEQADKVFLTLADGTENILSGASSYSEEAVQNGIDAVLFSRDDVTVNGTGSLTIEAPYRHGIAVNDDLVITGGTICVNAVQDAIHANNSLRVTDATLTLTAEDEGIDVDEENGWFYLTQSSVTIKSGADAINSAGDVTIDSGTVTIDAADDAIHSDTGITVNGGTIRIDSCYEGLEAKIIEVTGGDLTVCSSDDGFNANGSTGLTRMIGHSQETQTTQAAGSDEETYIRISGGSVTILNESGRDADGLDSNGSIYLTGGTVLVSLADSSGNCAIDFGSESGGIAKVDGGTLIACGSSTMVEAFDASSTQCVVLYNTDSVQAGTLFTLKTLDGQVLLSQQIPYGFSSIAFSCAGMTQGETYEVTVGDTTQEVTLTSTAVTLGNAATGMMGGMNNMQNRQEQQNGMHETQEATSGENEQQQLDDAGGTQTLPEDGTAPQMQGQNTQENTMPQMQTTQGPGGHQGPGGSFAGSPPEKPDGAPGDVTQQEQNMEQDSSMPLMPEGQSGIGEAQMPQPGSQNAEANQQSDPAYGVMQQQTGMTAPENEAADQALAEESGSDQTAYAYTMSLGSWILIGVSILVLAAGILIAMKARSNRI